MRLPLQDVIGTRSAALVVVDMQEAFAGSTASLPVPNSERILEKVKAAVAFARDSNLPVIWTKVSVEHGSRGPYAALFPEHFSSGTAITLKRGLPDFEIVASLRDLICPADLVIEKDRYSAFLGTNLETYLSNADISVLFVCGVTTNVCVESTIRDAFQRDFYCVMLSDCTATFSTELQKHSEQVIAYVFGWVTSLEDVRTLMRRK